MAAACAAAVQKLADLGAHVEAVDPGFEDPLDITCGLWFVGAWTLWNGLTPQQHAVADPDFKAEAQQGASYSALDVQRLNMRRGVLGSHLRQFMHHAAQGLPAPVRQGQVDGAALLKARPARVAPALKYFHGVPAPGQVQRQEGAHQPGPHHGEAFGGGGGGSGSGHRK